MERYRLRTPIVSVLMLCVLATTACAPKSQVDSTQGESTAPSALLKPTDDARDAAADANQVIEGQSTEVDALTHE